MDLSQFYVITPYFNPTRSEVRKQLYFDFKQRMHSQGVKLCTIELQLGDRPWEVINTDEPLDRGLRSWDEIWQKEAMINYAVFNILPDKWEYMAWIDGDISFVDPLWAAEAWQQMQHYMWIQLFQTACDLGPDGQVLQTHNGFVWSYLQGLAYKGKAYTGWHPGYAWACRREAFDGMGGLLDIGIAGASDHHMALALIDRAEDSFPPWAHESYKEIVMAWQHRADDIIRRDIGYVPGTINHFWHGKKKDRKYIERWKIIDAANFNPNTDVLRTKDGLWRFSNLNPALRDNLRTYFRQRNEDSIDLE